MTRSIPISKPVSAGPRRHVWDELTLTRVSDFEIAVTYIGPGASLPSLAEASYAGVIVSSVSATGFLPLVRCFAINYSPGADTGVPA